MAYLFDGGFTGFLYSMRETGRKLKDGAKELVEDFISGFNGHGWKLWKRNDSWRLEVDELLVRKSLTTFEMIISQITSIKGSQAITQGNAKVKAVTLVDNADVYEEQNIIVYNENFLDSKWYTFASDEGTPNLQVTKAKIICSPNTGNNVQALMFKGNTVIESFKFTIQELSGSGIIFSYFEDGVQMTDQITEIGEYDYPGSDGTGDESQEGGFVFLNDTSVTVTQIASSNDIIQTISQKPSYRLEIDNELNTISEFDLVRCQKGNKFYYVQVGSVFQYYINIPISEFETDAETGEILNPPTAGDELVQFGNASYQEKYKNRHSAIYMHLDENEPAIDLMTDIYSKDWSKGNIIKTRIGGNLPGTNGDRGFYCVNGKILSVDENGETVYVINPDGSASFARGGLSWTKDGIPYFRGQIIAGNENGKRIEINPDSATIEIYNEENTLVNVFEGNSYTSIDDLFVGTLPPFTPVIKNFVITNTTTSKTPVTKIEEYDIIQEVFFTIDSGVSIAIGEFTFAPNLFGNGSYSIKGELVIKGYDSPNGNVLYEKIIRESSKDTQGSSTVLFQSFNLNISTKGTYRIFFRMTATAVSNDGTSVLAGGSYQPTSFSISKLGYMSKFFANGFALGTGTNNLFVSYNKHSSYFGDYMIFKLDNGNVGIDAQAQKLMLKANPLGVDTATPAFASRCAFYGYINFYDDGTVSNNHIASFDGKQITVSITYSNAAYKIITLKYPTEWSKYNFRLSGNLIINIRRAANNKAPNQLYVYNEANDQSSIIVYTPNGYLATFEILYKMEMY